MGHKSQEIHGGGIVERYSFVSSYVPSMLHHFVNVEGLQRID